MSLQLVAGASGSGKSHLVYKNIIEQAIAAPKERFYVIVPEQFSMETQSRLARLHPTCALINIDILSFNRLAYRVFEETGTGSAPIIEDTGKILILQKILSESKNELKIMKGLSGKKGAVQRLNSMLSEMMQYMVEPEDIDLNNENISQLLRAKLEDIRLIRKKFSEYTDKRYLTMEEVPQILSRVIEKYEPIQNATVVFDGFTGFVPSQLLVIQRLLSICKKVIVTVTVDKKASVFAKSSSSNLFHMSHEMASHLAAAAQNEGCEILPEIWLEDNEYSRHTNNKPLQFLEKQLFRYEYKTFNEAQDRLIIGEASNPDVEAEYVSGLISELVRCEGCKYGDFAVVTGDIEGYGSRIFSVLSANNIPCFFDNKEKITGNPAVEFVRAAVEMAVENFSYKSVFRWLKTGFTCLTPDEINILENYVLAAGIRGYSAYKKVWEKVFNTIQEDELEEINSVREKFVEATLEFAEGFKKRGASVGERTRALYRLITDNDIQVKCKALEEGFKAESDFAREGEFAQIYMKIMKLLEKLVEIMAAERASLELYKQLLDAAFEDERLGLIPQKRDQVFIGDIERSRLSDVRVLFFVGVNDGIIPKSGSDEGLLLEGERAALSKMNIKLAPDLRQKMYRQRLYLYLALTKPADRLYLFYSRVTAGGEAALPSYLINVIHEMFPLLEIEDIDKRSVKLLLETHSGREQIVSEGYKRIGDTAPDNIFLETVSTYLNNKKEAHIEALNRAAAEAIPKTTVQGTLAAELYGINKPYSASRLELFASCSFRHFLSYALKVSERDVFEFTAADIGTILHEAVRLFSDEMKRLDWKSADEATINKVADAAFMTAYMRGAAALGAGSREFDFLRLGNVNRRTAWAITQQLKRGEFIPTAFEQDFMTGGVVGIIDRIDTCKTNDVNYVRIIDYKSGIKSFDLNAFYLGTQLQLPLYMMAASELEGHKHTSLVTQAAGMYYYSMTDPLTEVSSLDEIPDENKLLSKFKLHGVTRNDIDILKLSDRTLAPGVSSDIIQVKINKKPADDGGYSFAKYSRVMSGEDFYNIEKYTRQHIEKTGALILSGNADINPKLISGSDSCAYCAYRGICRFDERIPGYKKTQYPERGDEEILRDIAGLTQKQADDF